MKETFDEWLGRMMRRRGESQADLARGFAVSPAAVNRWLKGISVPEPPSCDRIARYLNVSLEEVYALAGHPSSFAPEPRIVRPIRDQVLEVMADLPVAIPIHDQMASAGEGEEILDYAYWDAPKAASKNIVGLKVHGKSMEPDFQDGDTIFIDRDESAAPGDAVVFSRNGEVLVKRLRIKGGRMVLESAKGDIPFDSVQVVGVVLSMSRDVRG